ncbi:MAG TPA: ABC transporter permease [Cyclobacteriaceae bacterium]|nr:ABC transporter permease [Cyclobacteriaceae bacterium]
MNKILLIIEREVLNRVGKKSFLVATILIPLIFPAIIWVLIFINKKSTENEAKKVIYYVDESRLFHPDTSKYAYKPFEGSIEAAKEAYQHTNDLGLLYIPKIDINNPEGITLYSVGQPTMDDEGDIRAMLSEQVKNMRMERLHIKRSTLDSLNEDVGMKTISVTPDGTEKKSNSLQLYLVGMIFGILMYMFIFIYGAQVMQGIIEEKTSKVVEVIVSSVRPFQLMMGKILGLATVGLLQFLIWIILMTSLTLLSLKFAGVSADSGGVDAVQQTGGLAKVAELLNLPWFYIIFCFLFYFLGGYLIYGALFAAVGSAVDSPAEAQQFMFPVTLPLLISYMSLFVFILREPDSPVSVWLSIIPFTSPIAMMGRLGSDVPAWQLALSMVLLIAGFIFTTWVAGRIYRVGILMSGTKVNYKVLAKWFLMKG